MLKSILSPEDCAACRFCCSFRRQSLWETPLFSAERARALEQAYPAARFKPAGDESYTLDLLPRYKTCDSEEEAACPFLSPHGCVLSAAEKPFDCAIWPLRVCRIDGELRVMLENTCPALNKVPVVRVKALVAGGVGEKIRAYAAAHPDAVKPYQAAFTLVG